MEAFILIMDGILSEVLRTFFVMKTYKISGWLHAESMDYFDMIDPKRKFVLSAMNSKLLNLFSLPHNPLPQVLVCLHYAFGNQHFLDLSPDCHIDHLPHTSSDHSPFLIDWTPPD